MDVQDGFIEGIFNYCDRWCETCAFTSWCRLFADMARVEATLDPNLKPLVDAPLLPQDQPPDPPQWMMELFEDMNEAADAPELPDAVPWAPAPLPPEHLAVQRRAEAYCERLGAWRGARELGRTDPGDPRAVIGWFQFMIAAKIARALRGLSLEVPEARDVQGDADGSAKVALIGIERSHHAWLDMVGRGLASTAEAAPFVSDLVWLGTAVERIFPNARAFVRPAFDEPDEVARLMAADNDH